MLERPTMCFGSPIVYLEPEARLEVLGTRTLFNGKKTIEVLVRYSDAPEADALALFLMKTAIA